MKKAIFEGNIDNYSFIMKDLGVIEVWSDLDLEYPLSYIHVEPDCVKNEKDFHYVIMEWWSKNNSN